MWYILSRKVGNKRWTRHTPGVTRKETAEKRLKELDFHGSLDPKREYKVVHYKEYKVVHYK